MTGRRITKRFKGSFSFSLTVNLRKCRKSRLHLESWLGWNRCSESAANSQWPGYANTPDGHQGQNYETEQLSKAKRYRWEWQARRTPGQRWRSISRCPSALRCPWSLAAGVCHQHLGTWEYWLWFQSGMSPALSYSIPQRPVCKTWKKTMWEKPRLYRRHSLNGLILLPCQYWRMLTTCSTPEANRLLSKTPEHFSHQLSFMLRGSCIWLQPVLAGLLITRLCFPEPGVPSPRMGLRTVPFSISWSRERPHTSLYFSLQ